MRGRWTAMRIYDGSPRQDWEEVLRSIGAFADSERLKEILLLELEGGELEELDRLLQQRGHDDPLAHALDEFHSENFSPR